MTSTPAAPAAPSIRVLRGNPDDADVAALVAALSALASTPGGDAGTGERTVRARPGVYGPAFRPPTAWGPGPQPW